MLGRKKHESGFTLIELMIVVAIIGITSALAIPNYVEWKAQHDLREAVSEFASNLNLARAIAMNRNRQATVTIQLAASGAVQTSGVTGSALAIPPTLLSIFPPQTMNVSVTGFTPIIGGTVGALNAQTDILFSSMGLSPAPGNQVIQIANARGLVYSVLVMPSGKVTWCPTSTCS